MPCRFPFRRAKLWSLGALLHILTGDGHISSAEERIDAERRQDHEVRQDRDRLIQGSQARKGNLGAWRSDFRAQHVKVQHPNRERRKQWQVDIKETERDADREQALLLWKQHEHCHYRNR